MSQSVELKKPKTSLSSALNAIAEILSIAEEGLNDDAAISSCLALADGRLVDSVDRRVHLVCALSGGTLSVDAAKGLIASLKEREQAVYRERKMLEKILIRIKESTHALMDEHGLTVLKGDSGEFKIQAGVASLICDKSTYSRSYSNLIRADDSLDLPTEYLTYEQIATLNKEAIKDDLLKGGKLEWARLDYKKQIRMKQSTSLLR